MEKPIDFLLTFKKSFDIIHQLVYYSNNVMWRKYMKKTLFTALSLSIALAPAMAANVNSGTAPELATVPTIDGNLSDWASIPVFSVPMNQNGDNAAATPGSGDLDIVLKVAWDNETNAIYLGLNIIDESLVAYQSLGSTAGTGGWNNERLEIVIDGLNTGDTASSTTSGFHQQYTVDMPNTWDPWAATNNVANKVFTQGEVGYFNTASGGVPVSTSFIPFPTFERIEGSLNLDNTHSPWNIADEYFQSAGRIRATASAAEWVEAPVEYTFEVKIVVFEELIGATNAGFDINDPANIANGWKDFFTDSLQVPLDLETGTTIGFSPQMNDADVWPAGPREHQTNTTNVAGNWNSSESLTALVMGAAGTGGGTSVADWSLR